MGSISDSVAARPRAAGSHTVDRIAERQAEAERWSAEELVRWGLEEFHPEVAIASSFRKMGNKLGAGDSGLRIAGSSLVTCHSSLPYLACRPHSVFWNPDQRPARGSSPGRTGRVQCVQPMLG